MAQSTDEAKFDHTFKLVLLGDSAVGKSSLLIRFSDDEFSETHITTIGVDFRLRNVHVDGKNVQLQIWDTAGQEKFRTIGPSYYRNADGVIFVYDVTEPASFEHMQEWLNDVSRYMEKDPVKLLVGNKADLAPQRQVSEDLAQRFADDNRMLFFETSAKTSTNVTAAFLLLTQNLISRATPVLNHLSLKLHENSGGKSNNKCPCA